MAGRESLPEDAQIAPLTRRAAVFVAALGTAVALSACGEKPEPDLAELPPPPAAPTTTTSTAQPPTTTTTTPAPPGPRPPDKPRATPAGSVRTYVAALDRGDGAAVCQLLAPGALEALRLPEPNPSCEKALDRSIGHRDPKGPPGFEGAKLRRTRAVKRGSRARVVATVVTSYAGGGRPSTDDDIVYLKRSRAGWLILQPSAVLYRAVGLEPPLSALKPPSGLEF
jgi:hypothetical protein